MEGNLDKSANGPHRTLAALKLKPDMQAARKPKGATRFETLQEVRAAIRASLDIRRM